MIPAAELAALQAAAAVVLDTSCAIQRATNAPDGYGSASVTWTTIATVNALLSKPQGAYLQNLADKIGTLTSWQVVLPANQDVKPSDRLVIAGQTLTVQHVSGPESYEVLRVVLASEIRP